MSTTSRASATTHHDWYESRRVPAAEAMSHVRKGDQIHIPAPAGRRTAMLVPALLPYLEDVAPVTIAGLPAFDLSWYTPEVAKLLKIHVLFGSANSRPIVTPELADFRPWMVFAAHRSTNERADGRPLDVGLVAVSPPNQHGYCCFGNSLWDQKKVALEARTTIAVVDPTIPATFGDTWIHVSEIDWFVEIDPVPALVIPEPKLQPWQQAIADNVSAMVNDGDTVQVGLGATSTAIVQGGALSNKRDLAYWAELTVPGIIDLVKEGVFTGRHLATHPGKVITTSAGNSQGDIDFIADNPMFEFYEPDYVHNPKEIARNDNMVAINNAFSIDLTGQIAAGEIGHHTWSGTGGQLSFAMGAFMSRGGRSITALPATASGGTVSRICSQFERGQVVTVPRDIADIVITEYGIAKLLNKSQRERAAELIAVAHPDHRAELRREADRLFGC